MSWRARDCADVTGSGDGVGCIMPPPLMAQHQPWPHGDTHTHPYLLFTHTHPHVSTNSFNVIVGSCSSIPFLFFFSQHTKPPSFFSHKSDATMHHVLTAGSTTSDSDSAAREI
jgi:hypothetical protein